MEINKEDLENTLGSNLPSQPTEESREPQMSREVEIGFHNGAIQTLSGERMALIEMIQHVETRMQAHIKRMQELGVEFKESRKQE